MRAQAVKGTIFIILVTVIITIAVLLTLLGAIGGADTAVNNAQAQIRSFIGGLTGESCAGLPDACRRWVEDGLGLYFTYNEAGVYKAANPGTCGVRESICPSYGSSRIALSRCLEMCTQIIYCGYGYDENYDNQEDCVLDILDQVR
jgi:hypothetical protein